VRATFSPVPSVVAVVLELLVASSPSCDQVTPFAEIEVVELILPNECFCRSSVTQIQDKQTRHGRKRKWSSHICKNIILVCLKHGRKTISYFSDIFTHSVRNYCLLKSAVTVC